MSGGIPKKVWQGRMRTKTNQTGMKVQGFPSMIGRRYTNIRTISKRVDTRLVLCGSSRTGGWRCRYGVNGANAGANAREKYCKKVENGVNGVFCKKPQPMSRNLAGGVGHDVSNPRLNVAQGTCGKGALTACKKNCNSSSCVVTQLK